MRERNGKIYVGFWLDPKFVSRIDENISKFSFSNRSEYLRVIAMNGFGVNTDHDTLGTRRMYLDPELEWDQAKRNKGLIQKRSQSDQHVLFINSVI